MRRALLDTNLLLLALVGEVAPERLGKAKRVRQFIFDHFDALRDELKHCSAHVTSPHILAEASKLIGSGDQLIIDGLDQALASYILDVEEVYRPARDMVGDAGFWRVGLTDTVLLRMASDRVVLFTDDHALFGMASARGVEVVNILHGFTPR